VADASTLDPQVSTAPAINSLTVRTKRQPALTRGVVLYLPKDVPEGNELL